VARIDAPSRYEGRVIASALAAAADGADVVITGDYAIDRGTGAVPAFLAAELGGAQALGLVEVDTAATRSDEPSLPSIRAVRRLDGGRREILDVPLPAVLSVEGAAATLRRASLGASLATADVDIPVLPHPSCEPPKIEVRRPRPRPRNVHVPSGSTLTRVRDLLHVGGTASHVETVELDPPAAAARIVEQLRAWGYLDAPDG
jgi:electron transfer flavoprotein beta subunit